MSIFSHWLGLPLVVIVGSLGLCSAVSFLGIAGGAPPYLPSVPNSARQGDCKETPILFSAHHKTGTELMEQVQRCLSRWAPTYKVDVDEHFHGLPDTWDRYPKVVHWVRDPFHLIISSYHYHKSVGESWTREPNSAAAIMSYQYLINKTLLQSLSSQLNVHDHPLPEESYQSFLRRMPVDVGLRTEIRRFLQPLRHGDNPDHLVGKESVELATAHVRCTNHPERCKEVCLEQFFTSKSSFRDTWKSILSFLGICVEADKEHYIMQCIDYADYRSPNFRGDKNHISSHPSDEEMRSLIQILQEEDDGGMEGQAGLLRKSIGCA